MAHKEADDRTVQEGLLKQFCQERGIDPPLTIQDIMPTEEGIAQARALREEADIRLKESGRAVILKENG